MPKPDDGNQTPTRLRPGGKQLDIPADASVVRGSQTDIPRTNVVTPVTHDYLSLDLCCQRLSPVAMDTVIMEALRSHYSRPQDFYHDELKRYAFTGDDRGLQILLATTWQPTSANQKPSVVVRRGEVASKRIVIGDLADGGGADESRTQYVRHLTGQYALDCNGETDGQTELLTYETFLFFTHQAPIIAAALGLHDFQCLGISGLNNKDEGDRSFDSRVVLTYTYEYTWIYRTEDDPLRRVALTATTALDQV